MHVTLNDTLISRNCLILKQQCIKADQVQRLFSKSDFKYAFWQLELHHNSCYLAVFHANIILYCRTHLIMIIQPVHSKSNAALKPNFGHILHVFYPQSPYNCY